jgi:hypothetical protein
MIIQHRCIICRIWYHEEYTKRIEKNIFVCNVCVSEIDPKEIDFRIEEGILTNI